MVKKKGKQKKKPTNYKNEKPSNFFYMILIFYT